MTTITGAPVVQGNPPMKLVIQEERPYQGGDGRLSPGRYEATWSGTAWESSPGTALNVTMPRNGDPTITGDVKVFLTTNYADPALSRTAILTYSPATWVETSPGTLDLSVNPQPLTFAATPAQLAALSTMLDDGTVKLAEMDQLMAETAQQQAANNAQQQANDQYVQAGVRQSRALNALPGWRTALGAVDNVYGTLTSVAAPDSPYDAAGRAARLAWDANASQTLFAIIAPVDGTRLVAGQPFIFQIALRVSDLEKLPETAGFTLGLWVDDAAGNRTYLADIPRLTPTQARTPGTERNAGGRTHRVVARSGDLVWHSLSGTLPTTAATVRILPWWTNTGPAGKLEFVAPQLTSGLSTLSPYQPLAETTTEAQPEAALRRLDTLTVGLVPPLQPITYRNALRGQYSLTLDPERYLAGGQYYGVKSATVAPVWHAAANTAYSVPSVIESRVTVVDFANTVLTATPADLALIGVTPSDTSPPKIGIRFELLNTSQNVQAVYPWVVLHYGTYPKSGTLVDEARNIRWAHYSTGNSEGSSTVYQAGPLVTAATTLGTVYTRAGIPIPATRDGEPLVAVQIHCIVSPADASNPVVTQLTRSAIIAGSAAPDATDLYLNGAEDAPRRQVTQADLDPALVQTLMPAAVMRPKTAAAIGDSICHGDFNTSTGSGQGQTAGETASFMKKAAEMKGWTLVKNAGIGGCTVGGFEANGWPNAIVFRYERDIVALGDSVGHVFFEGGINDYDTGFVVGSLYNDTDTSHFAPAYLKVAKGILDKMPGVDLYCMTMLVRPAAYGDQTEKVRSDGVTVEEFRQAIRDVVAYLQNNGYAGRVHLVDMGTTTRAELLRNPAFMDASGFHPTDPGHTFVAQHVAPYLRD